MAEFTFRMPMGENEIATPLAALKLKGTPTMVGATPGTITDAVVVDGGKAFVITVELPDNAPEYEAMKTQDHLGSYSIGEAT